MKILRVYHSTWMFKFIYNTGYIYTPDSEITCVWNNHLTNYIKVLKGNKYEDTSSIYQPYSI